MTMTELVFVLLHFLLAVAYCFSGSGDSDFCDLTECVASSTTGRRMLLEENYVPTETSSYNCSLSCTNDTHPGCILCTPPKLVFPDGPVYLLDIPESHITEGAIQLNITDTLGNFTVQQTSRVVISGDHFAIPLDVTGFSCSEVSVQYGLGDSSVVTSDLCLEYGPLAPENISYEVQGICENGEINNATIELNWNETESFKFWISHYTITLTDDDNGYSSMFTAQKNTSSVTISNGPLLNRKYSLTVTPFPAGLSTTVQLTTYLPIPDVEYECSGMFDPYTLTYSLRFQWTIINSDCSIINNIDRFRLVLYSQAKINSIGFSSTPTNLNTSFVYPVNHSSTYHYTFHNLTVLLTKEYQIEFNTFYKNVQPVYHNKFDTICKLSAPPIPPEIVQGIKIDNFTVSTNGEVSFYVTWNPPEHINGNRVTYHLWVGARPLELNSELPSGSTLNNKIFYQTNIDGTEQPLFVQGVKIFSLAVIYAQVISTNDWCMELAAPCYSNWSQPLVFNVPDGSSTKTLTPTSSSTSSSYHVQTTQTTVVQPTKDTESIAQNILWPLVGVVSGLFLVTIVLVTAVACCCCYGGRLLKRDISMDPMIKLKDEKYPDIPYPPFNCLALEEWEIPRDILEVFENEKLGSGCFGEVCKGSLQMHYVRKKKRLNHHHHHHAKAQDNLPVAIKKLKKTADGKERADFLKEIDTMISVSETETELKRFVVNMLGCCRLQEPILLVVEFVPYGDLLNYLRSMKKRMQSSQDANTPFPYLEPSNEYSHLEPRSQMDQEGDLTPQNLLDFSRQISAGMEFLSGLDIIHRDLACRNILVDTNKQLKISDFGLARTVPQDEVYTLTNHGRLPLRWMAVESIFQREFTSASDVWSFGVLLWEICTMGAFPYSSLTEKDLLRQLKRGHRLQQPENCSYEIYEIMHRCWHPNPNGRPTFSDLHKLFDHFLSKHTQERYPYIEMDGNTPYLFDHLAPKSLSDYQAHMKEVLTIEEDVADDDRTTEYDGLYAQDPVTFNQGSVPPTLSDGSTNPDNKYTESGYSSPVYECSSQQATTYYPPSIGSSHTGLYRLQRQNNQAEEEPPLRPYDQLREESSSYNREVTAALNSIYMVQSATTGDEFYDDDLWQKKLSTITEVSIEDYQDS